MQGSNNILALLKSNDQGSLICVSTRMFEILLSSPVKGWIIGSFTHPRGYPTIHLSKSLTGALTSMSQAINCLSRPGAITNDRTQPRIKSNSGFNRHRTEPQTKNAGDSATQLQLSRGRDISVPLTLVNGRVKKNRAVERPYNIAVQSPRPTPAGDRPLTYRWDCIAINRVWSRINPIGDRYDWETIRRPMILAICPPKGSCCPRDRMIPAAPDSARDARIGAPPG